MRTEDTTVSGRTVPGITKALAADSEAMNSAMDVMTLMN